MTIEREYKRIAHHAAEGMSDEELNEECRKVAFVYGISAQTVKEAVLYYHRNTFDVEIIPQKAA